MELTCIICPRGCNITIDTAPDGSLRISGNKCPRGKLYAEKEATAPERTVTSSARVVGGVRPLVPVKTAAPVPKADIPAVLAAIRALRVPAPVALGDELLPNIVACDNVGKAEPDNP